MRVRGLIAAVVLASAGASIAVSAAAAKAPPRGPNSTVTTNGKPSCSPKVSVILTGTLHADATGTDALVDVTGGNHFSKAYKGIAQPVDVKLASSTKISVRGHHTYLDLKQGYRAVVQAQVCKSDLANGATPQLTAKRVTANPPKSP